MSRHALAIVIALGLALLGGSCTPPAGDGSSGANADWTAEQAMEDLVRRWDETLADGEVDKAMALYVAADPVVMPPDMARHIEPVGVEVFFRNLFENGGVEAENRLDQVLAADKLVIGRGTYTVAKTDESGNEWDENGKWVAVTRRRDDGSLEILRNIWNRDAVPPGSVEPHTLAAGGAPEPVEIGPCYESPSALDDAFAEFWVKGEISMIAANHTEQGMRMPPGRPVVSGREAVLAFLQAYADLFDERQIVLIDQGEIVEGELGASWGRYHIKYVFDTDKPKEFIELRGKYLAVATFAEDECWYHEWFIWNHNEPWPTDQ